MVTCCQCEGIERQFGGKTARAELRRLRKRGPVPTTRLLVEALRREGVAGASILDVGGGVGAVHHELLDAGARDAVHVDVSPDYLDVAREEAERRGHGGQVQFVRGDFVHVAPDLGAADVVTLDRVICCYPDMAALVERSAEKARRLYGAVYPREAWWMRLAIGATNVLMRLRRSAFRVYLHAPAAIDAALRRRGLERRSLQRTLGWEVAVYARLE
jgi:magnesium-protoporphyrin O-methyltransferase